MVRSPPRVHRGAAPRVDAIGTDVDATDLARAVCLELASCRARDPLDLRIVLTNRGPHAAALRRVPHAIRCHSAASAATSRAASMHQHHSLLSHPEHLLIL